MRNIRAMRDFDLEVYLAKWEFSARHHMTASDSQTMTVSELLSLATPEDRARWDEQSLAYIETWGTPELRRAIADTYSGLSSEDILCFAGAEEGLLCAFQALLGPDDHAIITTPNYQSMETVPLSLCSVTGVKLRPEHGWQLDMDEVRRAVRPSTRVVAVNFPNNPTGAIARPEIFAELIAFCAERNIYLFSDEVYRGLERDPARRLPPAAEVYDKALSLNVMSKAYGMPGLRVGWIACRDRDVLSRMERLKHYLSICNAGPSEILATIALKARDTIFARQRALIERNLVLLRAFFAEHEELYEWYEPDSGCIGFPRYKAKDGVEAHCQSLVRDAGVLLLPASIYRSELCNTPTDRFRVGYGRRNIEAGLTAWHNYLRGNNMTTA